MANKPKKLVKARGEVHKARAVENEWKKRFYAMRDQRDLLKAQRDFLLNAIKKNTIRAGFCDMLESWASRAIADMETVSVPPKTTEPNEHEK